MYVYSLFDRKMKEYGGLVLANNDETVKRALVDGLRGTGSTCEKYPEDFDLMFLGEFDAESGVMSGRSPRLVENVRFILSGGVNGGPADGAAEAPVGRHGDSEGAR